MFKKPDSELPWPGKNAVRTSLKKNQLGRREHSLFLDPIDTAVEVRSSLSQLLLNRGHTRQTFIALFGAQYL